MLINVPMGIQTSSNRQLSAAILQLRSTKTQASVTLDASHVEDNCSVSRKLMAVKSSRRGLYTFIFQKRGMIKEGGTATGLGKPSIYHAVVVIFLEFFAWGLLTVPIINVLAETFPTNKFLMNGLILGVKGLLSFLSAPLVGALSDIWGRKFFLLITVVCTCMPIPLLRISPWWYFALCSISGIFSVTFSVVLAYVADITDKDERNSAYGLVSATFGASLVTSPALGAYISQVHSDEAVVALATAVAVADVFFIMLAVPESLPSKLRLGWDRVTWETADPFATLRKVGEDSMVVALCLIVFLSYLPEAGQFSCFFVYLKLVVGFSPEAVAAFIGIIGILSVIAQTGFLMVLQRTFGPKHTILLGLAFQCAQLLWYGFGTESWMMWAAGILVACSQITYPSISSFVSINTDKDKQGTVQGIVTGIRGLCQGLGPAVFGFIFYLFNVDLNTHDSDDSVRPSLRKAATKAPAMVLASGLVKSSAKIAGQLSSGGDTKLGGLSKIAVSAINASSSVNAMLQPNIPELQLDQSISIVNQRFIPGPPFLFGALLIIMAMFIVVAWLPHLASSGSGSAHGHGRLLRRPSQYTHQYGPLPTSISDDGLLAQTSPTGLPNTRFRTIETTSMSAAAEYSRYSTNASGSSI